MHAKIQQILLVAVFATATAAFGATIYVDVAQTTNTETGTSWPDAWNTVQEGADDLTNYPGGGNSVLVRAGTYAEGAALTSVHSGTSSDRNVFVSTNGALLAGMANAFKLNSADYIVIDGFEIANTTGDGIQISWAGTKDGSDNVIVRNCLVYKSERHGIHVDDYVAASTVSNCTIFGSRYSGISTWYGTAAVTIENCNLVNNGEYGVCERDYRRDAVLLYNNLYANGAGGYLDEAANACNTEDEINGVGGNAGNIVRDPGFSDLANGWDFSEVYVGSPVLNAGSGNADIGHVQDPPTVPTSANTYYVATTGSDSRSLAEAQSQSTPWATISKAAAEAVAGDTVIVNAGTYAEDVTVTRGGTHNLPVTYRAAGPVVVDGTTHGFRLSRVSSVVLDGFATASAVDGVYFEYSYRNTLVAPASYLNSASGLYFDRSSGNVVSNANVYGNTGHGVMFVGSGGCRVQGGDIRNNGIGVRSMEASLANLVANAAIYSNTTYGVGTVTGSVRPSMIRLLACDIHRNGSHGVYLRSLGGSAYYDASGHYVYKPCRIQNCNVYLNDGRGIGAGASSGYLAGRALIENCTIWNNGSDGGYAILDQYVYRNCIIAESGGWGHNEVYGRGYQSEIYHNAFYNNASGNFYDYETGACETESQLNAVANGTNNIVCDPGFVDAANGDFRLLAGSRCIDAGATPTHLDTDYLGNPRLTGGAVDIGSHEWQPPAGTIISIR